MPDWARIQSWTGFVTIKGERVAVDCDISLSPALLAHAVQKACETKGKQSVDGPIRVKVLRINGSNTRELC